MAVLGTLSSSRWANSDSDDDTKTGKTAENKTKAAATREAIASEAQKPPSKKSLPPAKGLSSSRWADEDEGPTTSSSGPTASARLRGSPKKKQSDPEAEAVAEEFGKRLKLPSQSDLDTDRQKENHDDRVASTNTHGVPAAATSKWTEERERNQKARITKSNNLSWRTELDDDDLFSNKQSLRNSHGGDESRAHGGRRLSDRNDLSRRDGGWGGSERNSYEGSRNSTSRRDNRDGWGLSRRDDTDRGRGARRNPDDSWIRGAPRDDNKKWGRADEDRNDNWGRRNETGSSRRLEPVSSQPANRERLHDDFDGRRQTDQGNKPVLTTTTASTKTDVKTTEDNSASVTDPTAGRSQALEKLMNTKIGHFDWADEDDF